jgi:hypothetical protein
MCEKRLDITESAGRCQLEARWISFLSRKPASKEGSKLRGDVGSLLGGETSNKVVISFFVGQETKRVRDGLDAQN